MNVVEASGLGKRYRRTWALRECTLEIPAGRVAALVGPNGAGKTTLLNLAVGLTPPSAGAVSVLGRRARPPRWTGSRSSPRTRRCTRACRSRT
jgi:ABC-2 type transport system ATP-binding protein